MPRWPTPTTRTDTHLSKRDKELLLAYWHSEPRKETAARLGLKENTITEYRERIRKRYDCPTVLATIRKALKLKELL